MQADITKHPDYSKLAEVYDAVMEDVNYEFWADFIDEIILRHYPEASSLLELACGTGSVSLSLDELECYEIVGTDKSPQMIQKARQKNEAMQCKVEFKTMDFLHIDLQRTFDVVFCVFDSVNYIHSPREVLRFLEEAKKVLTPESLLIFDFTTPKNSIQAIEYLNNEEGFTDDNYRYFRKSTYEPSSQIHTNDFKIEQLASDHETVVESFRETHQQKIYTLQQMLDIISQTTYNIVAKYDGFDFIEADNNSLRITMVLQCPHIQ